MTLGPVSSSFQLIFGQVCIYVCIHLTFVIICNFQVYDQFTVQTCWNDRYVYSPIKARVGVRVTKGCHGFRSLSVCLSVFLSNTLYYSLRASHLGLLFPFCLIFIQSLQSPVCLLSISLAASFTPPEPTFYLFSFASCRTITYLPIVIWWHPFLTIMHLRNS